MRQGADCSHTLKALLSPDMRRSGGKGRSKGSRTISRMEYRTLWGGVSVALILVAHRIFSFCLLIKAFRLAMPNRSARVFRTPTAISTARRMWQHKHSAGRVNVRNGSCVTSAVCTTGRNCTRDEEKGPSGPAIRQSGAGLKPPQAAVVKSDRGTENRTGTSQ